ncbi:outer membrane protein OmpA-like peptidoglycan-associated protein [Novosphingobium chloroacetimidivorans]|uniref:Outer membrane protein OmpA-like peptidoglycan-associated protein n=1 Tax=Novosphingobium chloroacetimidivorans TaxID=1428314 RepID=A0A7W7K7G8_9SPHN|nr:OmpA family protein [Novosphingobium chloroacetimidivorans]MBB4857642.1 outer membrane protein OmpA-like peptidoglycan-associated protein [Novosphingobium chloroacetimidivorans]
MRVTLLAVLVLTSAACSDERAPEPGSSDAPPSAARTSPPPPPPGEQRPKSGGLVGQVSPLNSALSDLNVRVTDMGTIIDLPTDALFAFDSAELNPDATKQLEASARMIRSAPAGPIKVIGHTDSKGDDAYNQKLSEDRAQAVAAWLMKQVGVRKRAIETSGEGEKAPIAPNETLSGQDDPAGRARNRRVELVLPR